MFSFLNRNKKRSSTLKTDLHSHLIPGIDDGAKTIAESIILLKALKNLGYEKIITTPHIMNDSYKNGRKNIMSGVNLLREEAAKHEIQIEIEAAAEYYLDDGFYDQLDTGDILTIGDKYLLFETSYIAKPLQFEEMVCAISSAGYKPMLAHPERYRYLKKYDTAYRKMKDMGIFFQVNSNSFGGHYGRDAQKKAKYLSREGLIDFLGSDIHHVKQVETLGIVHQSNTYKAIFHQNNILNDML